MKLTIKKLGYSSHPWRLVDEHGGEIEVSTAFDHPMPGNTVIYKSVSGNTKRDCIESALSLLARHIEKAQKEKSA